MSRFDDSVIIFTLMVESGGGAHMHSKIKIATAGLITTLLASGCAHYRPIVDMKGVNHAQYEQDLSECQGYAAQVDAGGHAAGGAVAGAVFGLVIGAIIGGRGSAGMGAALGGTHGVAAGGAHGIAAQRHVVMNCLAGRGYRPLY